MKLAGGAGDDVTMMYGGPANDSMTYTATAGNDTVTINGGDSTDTLIINKKGENFTLKDYQGRVMFKAGNGGSVITVANLERIEVIGDAGTVIYLYTAPPPIPTPPPDSEFDYVKVDDARGQAGVAEQIESAPTGRIRSSSMAARIMSPKHRCKSWQ